MLKTTPKYFVISSVGQVKLNNKPLISEIKKRKM